MFVSTYVFPLNGKHQNTPLRILYKASELYNYFLRIQLSGDLKLLRKYRGYEVGTLMLRNCSSVSYLYFIFI